MTDIDKLEAGLELDALVAEKVMGWFVAKGPHSPTSPPDLIPRYSTDIAAAWEVVEKMIDQGRRFVINNNFSRTMFIADFCGRDVLEKTAPLAICRAALKAVGA